MKIYKNPDGTNYDTLYPTLFFGSLGFNVYFLFKTCISLNHFLGLCLVALLLSFAIHHFFFKRKHRESLSYANLFITTTATPFLVAILLGLNYFISSEMFKQTSPIKGNMFMDDRSIYILHEGRPELCLKLYRLNAAPPLIEYQAIETQINMGILGFPVVKYHKFIK
jgi:hypothetical protein